MLLPKFEYYEPGRLSEACALMAELGEGARPLAGGTDLLVNMKKNLIKPRHVVYLGRIKEITSLKQDSKGFSLGSFMNIADIAGSPLISDKLPALSEGAAGLGSPLVRNLATIGGNIASARPAADMPPPLMVYGARIKLNRKGRSRLIAIEEFFTGPGKTLLKAGEILSEIIIDEPPVFSGASYIKFGMRRALEISLVSAASFISLESPEGIITKARIALGAVGPVPLRARSAEAVLVGEKPSASLFERAADAAVTDARPIDDFRGSAEYRRDMVKVLTRRTLEAALKRASH